MIFLRTQVSLAALELAASQVHCYVTAVTVPNLCPSCLGDENDEHLEVAFNIVGFYNPVIIGSHIGLLLPYPHAYYSPYQVRLTRGDY